MPTVKHSLLTGANTHEPKGADTAAANRVYVADGLGSGDWSAAYNFGWEDYNHAGVAVSLTAGSYVDLTNDGAGTNTNTTYKLPGHANIWNTSTNEFDFDGSGLVVGDTFDIRYDFDVTTSSVNTEITYGIKFGIGTGIEYTIVAGRENFKTAGTYKVTGFSSLYIGSSLTLNSPAKVVMRADTSGATCQTKGWYVRTNPRKVVFA